LTCKGDDIFTEVDIEGKGKQELFKQVPPLSYVLPSK